MRRLAFGMLFLGVALMVYGWWGIFTPSGQRAYDEMAGLIPLYGGILGAFLAVVGALILLMRRWRARRSRPA